MCGLHTALKKNIVRSFQPNIVALLCVAALQPLVGRQAEASSQTYTFGPNVGQSLWISRSDVLSCKLIQPIPSFGRAIFERPAGGELKFYLESPDSPFEKGSGVVMSSGANWMPNAPEKLISRLTFTAGEKPVVIDQQVAYQMMAELETGRAPAISRKAKFDETGVTVTTSPARFLPAYSDYRKCLIELAPVGWDKLERSRVTFKPDDDELSLETREWLDVVGFYLARENRPYTLFIDGHTDNTNTTRHNMELSQRRAQAVYDYLTDAGLDAERITLRYHGERYPVASNRSAKGKAKNRRVTLRVQIVNPQYSTRFAKR